jgi:hypothetical protein
MLFKNSILYLLFALLPVAAGAQNYFATGDEDGAPRLFYGGVAAGLNFSQVDGDTYAGYHKVGLNAGGLVYVRFSDRVGISLELSYSQKGARVKQNATDIYGLPYLNDYNLKLNYAEVPLMFYFVAGPDSKVHFKLGASYARLINASEVAVANYPVNLDPALYPFRKQDIGYVGEINYMFYQNWFLSFRYSYSITSIRDAQYIPAGYGQGAAGQFNNSFSLRLMRLVK